MKTIIHINPRFADADDFLKALPSFFDIKGSTLKNDRNEIKVIQHGELKLCVKSFKKVTVFNRYMYSWFRATKAKRSYKVARKLEKCNVNTPAPVGYVEVYGKWGILRKAFYVCLYHEHQYDMADIFKKSIDKQKIILTSFAKYMAQVVHPAGAIHNDLSPGNVLINGDDKGRWNFSLIDLNRMGFKRYVSSIHGLNNLKKITNDSVALSLMAEQYALSTNKHPQVFAILLIRWNFIFGVRRVFTKKILHAFKP